MRISSLPDGRTLVPFSFKCQEDFCNRLSLLGLETRQVLKRFRNARLLTASTSSGFPSVVGNREFRALHRAVDPSQTTGNTASQSLRRELTILPLVRACPSERMLHRCCKRRGGPCTCCLQSPTITDPPACDHHVRPKSSPGSSSRARLASCLARCSQVRTSEDCANRERIAALAIASPA